MAEKHELWTIEKADSYLLLSKILKNEGKH